MAVVSLNPTTFVETGLLDDADVEITDAAFCTWDYMGKAPVSLALGVEMTEINAGPDGVRKKHEQYYSAGDLQYFKPSADGASIEPVSDKTAMNSNTNAAQFIASLVKAGVPGSSFESGSIKGIVGLKCHVNRVAQPKRAGLTQPAKDGEREKTVLLVSRLLSAVPNAAGSGKVVRLGTRVASNAGNAVDSSPAGASTPQSAGTSGNPEIDALANATLINILVTQGGSVAKAKLPGLAFKELVGQPNQKAVVSKVFEDAFLQSATGITYDGSTVTLA